MENHSGKKKFICQHCNKSLSSKASLNQHIRIHTGEKPFKCNHCDRAFAAKSTLTSHLKMHTEGKKTFECQHCNKLFSWRSSLDRHMKTHITDCSLSSKDKTIMLSLGNTGEFTREL